MKITEAQLRRWLELDTKRKDLDRESRQLENERDLISTELEAGLVALGQDAAVRGDYRVSLIDGRPSVAWKDELVRIAGAEKAAELVAAAPVPRKIVVQEAA